MDKQLQRAGQPRTELPLLVDGQTFYSVSDLIVYLESLSGVARYSAVERVRKYIVSMVLGNDQILHDFYQWLLDHHEEELKNPEQREAWRVFRETHSKVRKRRQEGREALAGEGKWSTTEFWDDVIVPLTGASADVTDALRKIKKANIKPIETMQRGCLEMFRRWIGEAPNRFRKDKFCTGTDLKVANLGSRTEERQINQDKYYASGLKNLVLDKHGFLWHHSPPANVDTAVQRQRIRESDMTGSEPTGEGRSLRKRPRVTELGDADDDNVGRVEDLSPRTRASTKKAAKKQPSTHARKVSEMDRIFNKLNVVQEATSRARSESMKKKGIDPNAPLSPNRLQIPVKKPSQLQTSIWEVIEKRVRGIKFKVPVNISDEARRVMKLPAAQLLPEVDAIARGLAATANTEDTVLAYTQSLIDAFRLAIRSNVTESSEMSELRTIVNEWARRWQARNVRLVDGSLNQGGVELDLFDMSSLLLGEGYSGWLNGDIIHGALNIGLNQNLVHVVPAMAFDFWHRGNHADNMFDVPGHHPSLVVMVHWGNHWALMIADRATGLIHYLDSYEIGDRRQMAMSSMRNFLVTHPGYMNQVWRNADTRSGEQVNGYDCGVWAVQNAWAWMAGAPFPSEVTLADRLEIGQTVHTRATSVTRPPQHTSLDELEYLGHRNAQLTQQQATSFLPPSHRGSRESSMQTTQPNTPTHSRTRTPPNQPLTPQGQEFADWLNNASRAPHGSRSAKVPPPTVSESSFTTSSRSRGWSPLINNSALGSSQHHRSPSQSSSASVVTSLSRTPTLPEPLRISPAPLPQTQQQNRPLPHPLRSTMVTRSKGPIKKDEDTKKK